MAKKIAVTAFGAVVLRGKKEPKVLLVHRPAYDDWSLPKGKPHPDEDPQATAARELFEETGVAVRLRQPVGTITYRVSRGRKRVGYWLGTKLSRKTRKPDKEVDKVAFVPVDKARKIMTYAHELPILEAALKERPTATLIIVRHGKAMQRKHWSKGDWHRPLSSRGRRQSKRLASIFTAYGVESLASSSSTRCRQTLVPYSKASGQPIELEPALSEEVGIESPELVVSYMKALAKQLGKTDGSGVVCGHRPVLPTMFEALGVPPQAMKTGDCAVLHLSEKGKVIATEWLKNAF